MSLLLAIAFAVQQQGGGNFTSPPAGDTAGYWQQRVYYRIVGLLDEEREVLRGDARLTYTNNSPDTLREVYVHQYLNAFRPASRWSVADEREGRNRYQRMPEPHYGYERFLAPPEVNSGPARVEYPGAPDSTVVRISLPRPLQPHDSITVSFEWEARPSTLPRRQGRRGRHYDFAQWYPKVAVYDRAGWQFNALQPAGEFYGEFGTYDVTLILAEDQVVAATGVLVEGDPGWRRVLKWGVIFEPDAEYGPPEEHFTFDTTPIPAGLRRVRFFARDVHHFAWTTSPDYIYEGGAYDDRVGIHVLYRPGDAAEWGNGKAVERTAFALGWLESIFGPYPYPQVSNVHRLDGGGTEFPMMVMNGSASQGLILHEVGHIFTYGILANNEWRAGWLDEGVTSYQTAWAQNLTLHERAAGKAPPQRPPPGYRGKAARPAPHENSQIAQYRLDLIKRAEPIGTVAHEFNEFTIYNLMIYTRAEMMYGALRDLMGEESFNNFLRLYYDRWKLKHVDEAAIRRVAEEALGKDLDWFFDQWVHRIGLIDYALKSVTTRKDGAEWVTAAHVVSRGEYVHPMPLGVRTARGWTIVRGNPVSSETITVRTRERPVEVRLDPLRVTEDWDRRNDVLQARLPGVGFRNARVVFDWPFLDQADRNRTVTALLPLLWVSDPGDLTLAARVRRNYQGWIDRTEIGLGIAIDAPEERVTDLPGSGSRGEFVDRSSDLSRVQFWLKFDNPRLLSRARPLVGVSGGLWLLDGIAKLDLRKTWDDSPFLFAVGPRIQRTFFLTLSRPYDDKWPDPRRWSNLTVATAGLEGGWRSANGLTLKAVFEGGFSDGELLRSVKTSQKFYGRVRLETHKVNLRGEGGTRQAADFVRLFVGVSDNAPLQRSIGVSAPDASETFGNHYYRPRGGLLSDDGSHFVPLGDAGLRGYSPFLRVSNIAGLNVESGVAAVRSFPFAPGLSMWFSLFADAGLAFGEGAGSVDADDVLADAGAGVSLRGQLFDRDVRLRVDFPIYVRHPVLAAGNDDSTDNKRTKFRWTFSFNDFW
ncbi:MAG: M1 family metallopeptidase [Gemmatimonadaceae bacterium]